MFVTHYPSKKRPFYAADDPEDPRYTLSFDLLFRGLEVTTGGQRIHDYDTQVAKLIKKGMNPEDFAGYLMIHKYGTCPHGGLGLGLGAADGASAGRKQRARDVSVPARPAENRAVRVGRMMGGRWDSAPNPEKERSSLTFRNEKSEE